MASPGNESDRQQETFKTQLDHAAADQRERDQDPKPNPIVEKSAQHVPRQPPSWQGYLTTSVVTEFIPAAGKVLAPRKKPGEDNQSEIPGPPDRPRHDGKIEEFVRDQHRSKVPGGDSKQ
ncbi:uncharacterized protein MAM_02270 [Metarhizium album ARSEF 1941]|uniref:Uncharacterized protein n=1 Tax=Metarhizium album (strain ARSEF 1941) TaxID=1081103 RepID=A0A0B2WW04_METAS|nr:uncharacterized protein MAM_02270 [Metarhizium album ARSEF 1941]KHO00347.1 hypothetical protein MAM_02270 [Metarhizium album ARSEF 1941]